jgi:hypothetical protein
MGTCRPAARQDRPLILAALAGQGQGRVHLYLQERDQATYVCRRSRRGDDNPVRPCHTVTGEYTCTHVSLLGRAYRRSSV